MSVPHSQLDFRRVVKSIKYALLLIGIGSCKCLQKTIEFEVQSQENKTQ